MITADYYIRSGDAQKVMIIGAETLSRVSDPHDVDSMIYSDGAGATVLEASENGGGVLSHVTRSDTYDNAYLLTLGRSYRPERNGSELFVKMQGHDIYKYAVRTVPKVVKQSLDKAGLTLSDVTKVLIHQANQKMDEAILERLFRLYKIDDIPENIMPMTISWLGNSSVATLPTMLDLLQKGKLENHDRLQSGDIVVFASVGAGMNINSMIYQMH
jgi:3-oxoacyl-[acyl-carrier-protein] synthase-3